MNKTIRMNSKPPSELSIALQSDYEAYQICEQYLEIGSIAKECIIGTITMFVGICVGFVFIKINLIVMVIIDSTSFSMLPLLLIIGAIVKKRRLVQYCHTLNQQHGSKGLNFECKNFPYIDISILKTNYNIQPNTQSIPIDTFKSEQIGTFKSEQIDTFKSEQIDTFKSEQIDTFKSEQIGTFKSEQIDKLLNTPLPKYPSQRSTDIIIPVDNQSLNHYYKTIM